ncbi:MAG: phosphatidate cytidylyltransferase [Candidatus Thioglobus sp.]|nr:phosphatidate cytidylyltransferase [Candidatus Thioglobus sp.]
MLIKRALTALVLAPVVIAGILLLNESWFSIAVGLVLIFASREYCKLVSIHQQALKAIFTIAIIALTFILSRNLSMLAPLLFLTLTWWLVALYWIIKYPDSHVSVSKSKLTGVVNGFFLFVPMATSLIILQSQNRSLVLLLLVLTWAADVGAYFSGKRFGNKKLCPEVSPNKTLAGLYGGVILAQVVAIFYVYMVVQAPHAKDFFVFSVLALVVSLVSVLGDLFESLLKRISGVKDSGNILPGHGGLLDRIDSLTSTAPIFLLFLVFVL